MKSLSVIDIANLYGMNRQSIYKRIKKGDLSKNSDGKIDLSEAIRVLGEPSTRMNHSVAKLQSSDIQKLAEVDTLKQQVDILKKQLELAQEREEFQRQQLKTKDDQIFSLQLLLGAPSKLEKQDAMYKQDNIDNDIQEPIQENSIAVNSSVGRKKKSLFNRVINAVLS